MFQTEQIKSLNELELEVYEFIMSHWDKVRYMKIRELADEAHVSTTTILRFCKKMGCSGYMEFKMKFKLLQESVKTVPIADDVSEVVDFLKKSSAEEFEEKLEEMAGIIAEANRIIFVGSGMSGIVAKYGARYFSSMGRFSLCVDEPHYPTEGKFFEDALVIVFSVSGESKDTIGHITRFKQGNCRIFSVTNTENCTIARLSDYNMAYYVTYLRIKDYDVTTQLPAMSIVERLGRKLYNM